MRWLSDDGNCAVVCSIIVPFSRIINIPAVGFLMEADIEFSTLLAVVNSGSMSHVKLVHLFNSLIRT